MHSIWPEPSALYSMDLRVYHRGLPVHVLLKLGELGITYGLSIYIYGRNSPWLLPNQYDTSHEF